MKIRCLRGDGWAACPAKDHCRTRSVVKDIVAISGDFEGEKLDPLTSILVEKQMVPPQGLFFLVVGMHAGWQRLLVKKW